MTIDSLFRPADSAVERTFVGMCARWCLHDLRTHALKCVIHRLYTGWVSWLFDCEHQRQVVIRSYGAQHPRTKTRFAVRSSLRAGLRRARRWEGVDFRKVSVEEAGMARDLSESAQRQSQLRRVSR